MCRLKINYGRRPRNFSLGISSMFYSSSPFHPSFHVFFFCFVFSWILLFLLPSFMVFISLPCFVCPFFLFFHALTFYVSSLVPSKIAHVNQEEIWEQVGWLALPRERRNSRVATSAKITNYSWTSFWKYFKKVSCF